MSFVIDFVLSGTDRTSGGPEGMSVMCNGGPTKLAEDVEAGDVVCVNAFSATVTEVGRTEVFADGSRGARTVLSGGA